MKKINLLLILLLFSILSFGQDKQQIKFYKEMPHFTEKDGTVWQRDTICYNKISSDVDLYESSDKYYPYLYLHIDKNKEEHYYFIRKKDIVFSKNKIEIKMYDDSNEELSIFKMYNGGKTFSFKLNN